MKESNVKSHHQTDCQLTFSSEFQCLFFVYILYRSLHCATSR